MSGRRVANSGGPAAGVRYRIAPIDPKAHLFEVVCDIAAPDAGGQRFSLPAWIPGSYMIREFARNIVSLVGECRDGPVVLTKRDKHTWDAAPCDGPLRLRYRVYAWDWSVRAAHLDETHGFFNGTSVFVQVAGREDDAHDVEIAAPAGRGYRDWRVATTLPEAGATRHGFGAYRAANYDALIDHPVEMGAFRLERFDAAGVPHEIAYSGVVPNLDAARIDADLAVLCAAQIRFFAEPGKAKRGGAPFDRYLFLTAVAGEGYGGLEHRSSTALLCSRDALPAVGDPPERSSAYLTFLGLVSHEYFHSWNVKRMKPAAFAPYDLARENYTSLLWIFEGFTSYYDDLFLVRTGLATEEQYLGMLAKTIDDVAAGAGRTTQSVAESSFDAWIKYYRQDENTPNAVVSYYKKGSLVALCLDLLIRRESRGRRVARRRDETDVAPLRPRFLLATADRASARTSSPTSCSRRPASTCATRSVAGPTAPRSCRSPTCCDRSRWTWTSTRRRPPLRSARGSPRPAGHADRRRSDRRRGARGRAVGRRRRDRDRRPARDAGPRAGAARALPRRRRRRGHRVPRRRLLRADGCVSSATARPTRIRAAARRSIGKRAGKRADRPLRDGWLGRR